MAYIFTKELLKIRKSKAVNSCCTIDFFCFLQYNLIDL